VAIAAGDSHTVALKRDGTVVAWGDNEHGQTTIPSNLVGVVAIAAGKNHTVALVIPQSYPESNRLLTVDEVKSMIEEAAASAATIPLKLDVKTAKKKIIIEQEAELKRLRQAEELLEEARHFEALETRKSFWSTKNYIAAADFGGKLPGVPGISCPLKDNKPFVRSYSVLDFLNLCATKHFRLNLALQSPFVSN